MATAKKATAKKAATKSEAVKTPAKKAVAKKTVAKKSATHEEVAALARKYWAERGYHDGHAEHDWLRAERELNG